MKLLNVDTLQEAREKLLAAAGSKVPDIETIPFTETLGRVVAADIKAAENIPHFRRSTVDGYAVNSADTQGVTESIPVFLDVIETVEMGGEPAKAIKPGQATYVPTGGMVPEGADAMVMIEYCEKFDETSIAVYEPVSPGRNVVAIGEDIMEGRTILAKGRSVRPQEVGVMAADGVWEAEVFKPWKITVISTGDELVAGASCKEADGGDAKAFCSSSGDSGAIVPPGKIRDINTYSISAAAVRCGFEVIDTMVLQDDEAVLTEAVAKAMTTSDVVVVSGGSSQGEKDHTAAVMDKLGDPGVFTHGIALKPGKPTILGYDDKSETILVGLPGHPAAALMVFELMIGWLHRKLTGQKEPLEVTAEISENISAAGGRTTCLLVELGDVNDQTGADTHIGAAYRATPIFGKSGLMTTLTRADGYVMIEADAEGLREGQQVRVVLF